MKTLFALFTIVVLSGVPALAETVDFPNLANPLFTITIPDVWEPDQDDDEFLEATSPGEHVDLSVWELASKDDISDLEQDLVDQLNDHAKEIKIEGKPQKAHPGGMDGLLYRGHAVDKEDGSAIEFYAVLITTRSRAAVVFIEADAETPEAEANQLQAILKSITPPDGKKVLRAALALNQETRPTTRFTTAAAKIYAFYIGTALKEGDELKSVWFADDVGAAAPKNSRIDEATLTAATATDKGAFSLSRPTNGWPPGKYRVEILVNDKLVQTLKFTISPVQ